MTATTARDLMTATVVTIHPDDPVTDAARAMLDAAIGSLVIVDDEHRPAGILTRTDFVRLASDGESLTGDTVPTVRSVMETELVTVTPETPLEELTGLLEDHAIHHLPVVGDDEQVVGVVTTTDLASASVDSS